MTELFCLSIQFSSFSLFITLCCSVCFLIYLFSTVVALLSSEFQTMRRNIVKRDNDDPTIAREDELGKNLRMNGLAFLFRPRKASLLLGLFIFVSFCVYYFYLVNSISTTQVSKNLQDGLGNNEAKVHKDKKTGEDILGRDDEFDDDKKDFAPDESPVPMTETEAKVEKRHEDKEEFHVLLQLVNAEADSKFAKNFYHCIKSILSRTKLDLNFHLTVDSPSIETAENIFEEVRSELKLKNKPNTSFYMVDELNQHIHPYTKSLQELFSSGPNTYYSHAIFFISAALHKIFPMEIKKLVMMDTDLQFRTDIKHLFDLFPKMSQDNIMGLAREQQPVYRHVLSNYRHKNPGTLIGDPPPHGLTGFNSGVKLMNLENMRNSELYNSILHRDNVTRLANKYNFRGHLGDQDFFSLVSFDHPSLFYTLPCQWNRQLCTWWKDNGYKDVFDAYFSCTEPFYVIHGNCNTPIPQEGDSS